MEDGQVKPGEVAGLIARVTFDLPFCLYLDDGIYAVAREGWHASVRITRVHQTHFDPRLGFEQSNGTELVRDRHGRLRFSTVDIELPGRAIIEKETRRRVEAGELAAENGKIRVEFTDHDLVNDFSEAAFHEGVAVINRLIEVYRHVADEFQVRRVTLADLFKAHVAWFQENEPLGGTHHIGFGQGMTVEPESFDAQTIGTLRAWLCSTRPVLTTFMLFSDAKDRLDREEYRLAVIDARTALEVLIDELLLAFFALSGTSLEDGCRLLDVETTKVQSLEEALQRASINRKLGEAIKQVLHLDIHNGAPALWERWLAAKKLREAGAHRGTEVGRAEAFEAVNTMGEMMRKISVALRQASWSGESEGAAT